MNQQQCMRKSERGQSLIELALSFTILLILLAGVIDLGRAFYTFMALRDAAMEGAVYGGLYPTDTAGVEQRVRNSSANPVNMKDTNIKIAATVIGAACNGNGIQVDVTYESFPFVMPFWKIFFGLESINIHAKIVDEILRPPCK